MTEKKTGGNTLLTRLQRRRGDPRVSARRLRRPGVAEWIRAVLARYGSFGLEAWPPSFVFTSAGVPGTARITVRHNHRHMAQSWAPRLNLTVVTGARPAGAESTPASPGARGGRQALVQWRLLRAASGPQRAVPAPRMVVDRPAVVAALATMARVQGHTEAIDSVEPGRPRLATAPTGAAPRTPGPVVVPVAPVPRVVHRAGGATSRELDTSRTEAVEPLRQLQALVREPAPAMPAASVDPDPATINRITDRVMQQIGHRIQAHRERTGRA